MLEFVADFCQVVSNFWIKNFKLEKNRNGDVLMEHSIDSCIIGEVCLVCGNLENLVDNFFQKEKIMYFLKQDNFDCGTKFQENASYSQQLESSIKRLAFKEYRAESDA